MKRLILVLFTILSSPLLSQTIEDIKNSNNYYYGEGYSNSIHEATQMALTDLVTQLKASITVQSSLHQTNNETSFNNNIDVHSEVFLNGTYEKIERTGKGKKMLFHVLRYISIDSLNKEKAYKLSNYMGYIAKGDNYLDSLDVSNALKYYYWSFTLTANDWKVSATRTLDDTDYNINYFRSKIDSTLASINFKIKQIAFSGYEVTPFYKSQPLRNLSYMVLKNGSWEKVSNNYIQFDEDVPDEISFKVIFETFDGLAQNEEIRYILNRANKVSFNSTRGVSTPNKKDIVKNIVIGSYGTIYITTDSHAGIVTMNGKIWGETPILMKSSIGPTRLTVQDKITGETKKITVLVQAGTISYLRIKF